jgi:hypothetical protein
VSDRKIFVSGITASPDIRQSRSQVQSGFAGGPFDAIFAELEPPKESSCREDDQLPMLIQPAYAGESGMASTAAGPRRASLRPLSVRQFRTLNFRQFQLTSSVP